MPPKPVLNVWNLRMEKMAAIRAAVKPDVDREDPFVVKLPDHLKLHTPLPDNSKDHVSWPHVGEPTEHSDTEKTKPSSNPQPDTSASSSSRPLSTHTSASHSRAQSVHSSPKLARNPKKLAPDSDNRRSLDPADATSPDTQDLSHAFYHDHSSSANSSASSPRLHQLQLLSPPPSATSSQSLLPNLQHPSLPLSHTHPQSTYPHAPYPLYNLTMPPINSYDYPPHDTAPRPSQFLPYPAPPDLTTLSQYPQPPSVSLPNGSAPIQSTDRSPTETETESKSTHVPAAREKMVFGSIDISSNPDHRKAANNEPLEQESKEDETDKEKEKKKPFAIGLENGRDLPGRSRPNQKKTVGKASSGRKEKNEKKDEKEKKKTSDHKEDISTPSSSAIAPKPSIPEPRWTFGTTSLPSPLSPTSDGAPSPSIPPQPAAKVDDTSAEDDTVKPSFTTPVSGASTPFVLEPQASSYLTAPSSIPSMPIQQTPHHHHPYHLQLHPMHSPAHSSTIPLPPPISIPGKVPISIPTASSSSDPDLEVKDYGWGFGDASGMGYAPILAKERAQEWEAERVRGRAAVEPNEIQALGFNNEDVITSPMTESARDVADKDNSSIHDQGLPREHIPYLGRGRRGFPNGRGGYGAGNYRRPRGNMNGFTRGFGRGGYYGNYGNHHNRGGLSPVHSRAVPASPYNVTPPHHFQTLPLDQGGAPSPLPPPPLGGFYHPHPHHPNPGRPYIPPGYEAFNPSPTIAGVPPPLPVDPSGVVLGPQTHLPHLPQNQMLTSGKLLTPPVPVPKTTISFPLDSTRYYLLGQLEYYLSAENMAQDFYLRQQMDARGWIPISLIASFNRVRQLTQDVQLVKDVLYLSSLVQVRGNMVRMGGWEPFVLPDAAPSTVEEQPLPYPYQNLTNYFYTEDANGSTGAEAVNGEMSAVGYPELLHATPLHHHNPAAGEGGGRDVYSGGAGITKVDGSLVNGHAQEIDDEDEDEVEIVMGQGVGTFMYDRRTASS